MPLERPCLKTFVVGTTWEGRDASGAETRATAKILHSTGQPPPQRITRSKMLMVPKQRNPGQPEQAERQPPRGSHPQLPVLRKLRWEDNASDPAD